MKKRKSILMLILSLTILMSAALFASCSTFPTAPLLKSMSMSYEILGYVGASYGTYDEAFTAAKAAYRNADAVIRIKGKLDDKFIPGSGFFGFYAIKFVPVPRESFKLLK